MATFQFLSKSHEMIQARETFSKFHVRTIHEQKSVITRKKIDVENIYTVSKEIQKNDISFELDKKPSEKKIKKIFGNFFKAIIGFDETIDMNFPQFLGRKIQSKLSQHLKRKELEDHADHKRRPSIADGLFSVFFPEIFVLEDKRKQLNKELLKVGPNSRMIPSDIKSLAKSLVKFTCSSVKTCKSIGYAHTSSKVPHSYKGKTI